MVKIVSIGFTIAFIKASTNATSSEIKKLSTLTPGSKLEAIKTATPLTNMFTKKSKL